MLALLRANYGDVDFAQESFFRWQYEENPAGPAQIWLAEDPESEVLAGQYVVIPMRLCLDGAERLGCLSLNTLTDARYRGRGIFTGLARRLFSTLPDAGVALTYGFPNPNSYPGFVEKLEFRDIGQAPLMVKPLDVQRLAGRKFGGVLGSVLGTAGGLLRPMLWPRTRTPQGTGIQIIARDTAGPEFDEFWESQKRRHRLMVVRDARYIAWRYLRCPTRRYNVLSAVSGDRVTAYLVGRIAEVFGVRAGLVVDMLLDTGERDIRAAEHLLAAWESLCASESVEVLAGLMLPHVPEAIAFRRCGYWTVPRRLLPQPMPVIMREHETEIPKLGLRDCFLTFGDYDSV